MKQLNAAQLKRKAYEAAINLKAKPPLKGFEFVDNFDQPLPLNVATKSTNFREKGPLPNAKYQYAENLPKYQSFQKYVSEATKARFRLNMDRKEGWWLKIAEFQKTFKLPLTGYERLTLNQKYKSTRKQRTKILKEVSEAKPVSTSRIQSYIDLDELHAVDHLKSVNVKSRDPDIALSGAYLQEPSLKILAHNGIFRDLKIDFVDFSENIDIFFEQNSPVLYGNEIGVSNCLKPPKVNFQNPSSTDYTVSMISLDSGLDKRTNYLHWLAHWNSETQEMEEVVKYMPVFPSRGTGYHRTCILIYKNLDRSNLVDPIKTIVGNDFCLNKRENLGTFEGDLVSLRFMVNRWEPKTVSKIFAETLQMKEPVYEFDFPNQVHLPAMTRQSQDRVSIQNVEAMMADEPIYPGLGQPEDYQVTKTWNEFNQSYVYKKRRAGK